MQQIAPLGWDGLVAKMGPKAAVKILQNYRKENPSSLERLVMAILDDLAIEYEREVWFETPEGSVFLVDFVLADGRAIEVQGAYVHQFHAERDHTKLLALEAAGFSVLILTESDVKSGSIAL